MTDHFDFSHALTLLKAGKRVAREAWHEWGELACVEMKDDRPDIPQSPLFATGAKGSYPWWVKQDDLMAEDWHEVTG